MLSCEKCKVQSRVIETRYAPKMVPPYIRRTRCCPKCNKRWTTMELMAGEAKTAKQRTRGRGTPVINNIRRAEYLAISDELHRLADRVAIGEVG